MRESHHVVVSMMLEYRSYLVFLKKKKVEKGRKNKIYARAHARTHSRTHTHTHTRARARTPTHTRQHAYTRVTQVDANIIIFLDIHRVTKTETCVTKWNALFC